MFGNKSSDLPLVSAKVLWDTGKGERLGKVKVQNLTDLAISIMRNIIKEHDGKVINAREKRVLCSFSNSKKAIQAAMEMQRMVSMTVKLKPLKVGLAIGFHYGEAKISKDGIAGEAVGVSKQLMEVAELNQIVITKDAMQNIPASMSMKVKLFGKIRLKSRLMKMEVYKVIWEEEEAEQTIIQDPTSTGNRSVTLSLQYQGKNYKLGQHRSSFLMGRGDQNDLLIDASMVSRNHGVVKLRQGKFFFQDRSSNGTYLRMETREDFKVHQEEIHLHGKGILCLGEKIKKEHPHLIYFILNS